MRLPPDSGNPTTDPSKALEGAFLAFGGYAPYPCTLHPAPCTLHPAPCILHPASCTLHLAPPPSRKATLSFVVPGNPQPSTLNHCSPEPETRDLKPSRNLEGFPDPDKAFLALGGYRGTSLIRNSPPPLGPPQGPRHMATVESYGGAVSYDVRDRTSLCKAPLP